jgi:hypothetical protein
MGVMIKPKAIFRQAPTCETNIVGRLIAGLSFTGSPFFVELTTAYVNQATWPHNQSGVVGTI